jgi:hypothetical protein
MFWSDPSLYGVTLPYKDIANPLAMTGWHNIPRFLPPTYGLTPPYFMPQVNPQTLAPQTLTPQTLASQPFTPMAQPFAPVAQPFAPMAQPFAPMAQPFGPFIRPETFNQPVVAINPYLPAYQFTPQSLYPLRPFGC